MAMTSVRMPDELLEKLESTADNLRRSKGWVIKEAVQQYIAREELKQQRNQQTLESWRDYQQGKIIDGAAVEAWLESWGDDNEPEPPVK